jgi:antitoxin MazE
METTIQKWGNSLGIRLPKNIVKRQSLHEGARVVLDEQKIGIVIRKPAEETVDLDALVRRITKKNRHQETDWGNPVGKEVW